MMMDRPRSCDARVALATVYCVVPRLVIIVSEPVQGCVWIIHPLSPQLLAVRHLQHINDLGLGIQSSLLSCLLYDTFLGKGFDGCIL
jgi:hypothetical protein